MTLSGSPRTMVLLQGWDMVLVACKMTFAAPNEWKDAESEE